MYRLLYAKHVWINNFKYSIKRSWDFCGNPTASDAIPCFRLITTTSNCQQSSFVSTTNHNNHATTYDKYSIINSEPAVFGTDEILDEVPLLFVGKSSVVDPTQNLQELIKSYNIFKEISSIEDKDYLGEYNEFGEYKSKYYKTIEDEHLAKHKLINKFLASYAEVCVARNALNRAFQCILHYREKYKLYKLSIGLYNMVLGGFAENANLPKMQEALGILTADEIACNAQSYAAVFECLGRLDESTENLKLLRNFILEAEKNGITLNDIFNLSKFTGNKREIVMNAIRRIDGTFTPIYSPPQLLYNNCLLDGLNKNIQPVEQEDYTKSGSEILNEEWNCTLEEYQKMFNDQLQIELNGNVNVKSIEKFSDNDPNVLFYRSKIEDLLTQWHSAICEGFDRDLKSLELKSHCQGQRSIEIFLYLRLLKVENYADILLEEVRMLAKGSEPFGQSLKDLYQQIGQKVQERYHMNCKVHNGVLEKTKDIYGQYYKTLCDGRSSDNSRQMWQRFVHQNRTSGASMDIVDHTWPSRILVDVGRFLYHILIHDVKIDTNIMCNNSKTSNTLPAFYTVLRKTGEEVREEVEPHPVLAKLYRASQQEMLTFNVNTVPMLCPPQPWSSPNNGGYILAGSKLIRSSQAHRIKTSDTTSMYPSLDSLNQLASVAWKVNTQILDVVLEVFKNGGSKELKVSQPPSALPPLEFDKAENDPTLTINERYEMGEAKMAHRQTQGRKFGLCCDTLYSLSLANHYRDKVFWLPHYMDFRGRVYPIPPHLNHHSPDFIRSFLVFHQAKPLGVDGFAWLKLHCINLTGHKQRDSVRNRLLYADDMMDNIIDSADNPLTGRMWWVKSDKPWQTLATCMEITKAARSPDPAKFMSSFPIHQDGTCNGLQHFAALGRDTNDAYGVNLCPGEVPQDVYSDVAELVEKLRRTDEEAGVVVAGILKGYVERKIIKKTVIDTVYGSSRTGLIFEIAGKLQAIDSFPKEWIGKATIYLTTKTFESLREMLTSTKEIQDWLTNCARLIASTGGQNVEWITPLGLPIVQSYSQNKSGITKRLPTSKSKILKRANAFPANFITSLDASHMMLTSLHCERAGFTFMSVHDSYWTHACTVPDMNKICREQFVALHSQPILENLSKYFVGKYSFDDNEFQDDGSNLDDMKRNLNKVLAHAPKRGNFDLNNVLDAVYFFS